MNSVATTRDTKRSNGNTLALVPQGRAATLLQNKILSPDSGQASAPISPEDFANTKTVRVPNDRKDLSEPLFKALVSRDYQRARELLDQGAEINEARASIKVKVDEEWKTFAVSYLDYFFRKFDPIAIQLLVDYGFDLNSKGTNGQIVSLYSAMDANQLRFLRLFLEKGADPNVQNHSGVTAVMHAVNSNKPECLRVFVDLAKKGVITVDWNLQDVDGWSALIFACRSPGERNSNPYWHSHRAKMIKILRSVRADPSLQSTNGYKAADYLPWHDPLLILRLRLAEAFHMY